MTSPVLRALAGQQLDELHRRELSIDHIATDALGPAPPAKAPRPEAFIRYAQAKGLPWLQARPSLIAVFLLDTKMVGEVEGISAAHRSLGLADPTASWVVTAALTKLNRVEPPRSWPKETWPVFAQLPHSLQQIVERRERERDKAVRHAQTDASQVRKQLETLKGKQDGIANEETRAA